MRVWTNLFHRDILFTLAKCSTLNTWTKCSRSHWDNLGRSEGPPARSSSPRSRHSRKGHRSENQISHLFRKNTIKLAVNTQPLPPSPSADSSMACTHKLCASDWASIQTGSRLGCRRRAGRVRRSHPGIGSFVWTETGRGGQERPSFGLGWSERRLENILNPCIINIVSSCLKTLISDRGIIWT